MKYEFNQNDAYRFASEFGIATRRRGRQLQLKECPYCHGRSKGGKRDEWTFAISLENGTFNCKRSSCSVSGNMISLSKNFNFELTADVSAYHNINNYNNRFRKFENAGKSIETRSPAIEYLEKRGIPPEITKKYEVTTLPDKDNILCFPFKNAEGLLEFIKYRKTDYDGNGSKEWCESNCKPILYGMNQCNFEHKNLIITEGQIDSLSVAAAGFENAVSVPTGKNGFTWVPHCWDFVMQFEKIIVFGDKEGEEITLLDEIRKRFKKQIYHVRLADYKDCKDANEILNKYGVNQIQECINKATPVQMNSVKPLELVQRVDINSIEKIPTGIKHIDKLLKGGLPFGGITLITGKAGDGKSTLASQILLQALEKGYKTFAYSGELPNYLFKDWIETQLAGEDYVRDIGQEDNAIYKVQDDVLPYIQNWYAGRCWIYDSNVVEDEEIEKDTLISIVERVISQYDVRVVLIDNLMTALDLEPLKADDKYGKQSDFMKKLTRIALKYNVLIIVVAHKRKNSAGQNKNDEVSGSADVGNLAMVVINYDKQEKDSDDRTISISKNRLFGQTNTNGWITEYSPRDRRIFTSPEEHGFRYSWHEQFTDQTGGFVEADTKEVPF